MTLVYETPPFVSRGFDGKSIKKFWRKRRMEGGRMRSEEGGKD